MSELLNLPVSKIKTRPGFNPREDIDTTGLLASVKQNGILVPLTVRRNDDGYYLLAGERRLTAAILADLKEVPVLVRDPGDPDNVDADDVVVALTENLHRSDLHPVEEARGIRRLQEFGYSTVKQLAHKLGFSQKQVKARLEIVACPIEVQDLMVQGKVHPALASTFATIAKTSPELATAVAHRVDTVRYTSAEEFAYAWPQALHVDQVYNAETGDYEVVSPIEGYWLVSRTLPWEQLDLDDKTRDILDEAEQLHPYGQGAEFNDSDADAAKAYGCLLVVEGHEHYRDKAIVTDLVWLSDRVVSTIAKRALKEAKKKAKDYQAARATPGAKVNRSIADEAADRNVDPEVVKAERAKEREAQHEERNDAHNYNLEVGQQLLERLNEVKLDKQVADMIVGLILRDDAGRWLARGLTYLHPGMFEEEEMKNGNMRRSFKENLAQAREAASRFCEDATTPEEKVARALQLVVAAEIADNTVVSFSRRTAGSRPRVGSDGIDLAESKIAGGVDHLVKKLTPKARKAIAERQAARDRNQHGESNSV